ncbi:PREDICTED: cytokinin hydroxylase-like [Tarenaya hassleriana]|uniref:cytokinin hydroxylase-like n=1 Tax=Tarenaya hassleriana TaxID=28532 RepID=UPI00053C69B5|nr:PREDICTED: cytokinin hydroxylase-like [Tarenaya hassleriana]
MENLDMSCAFGICVGALGVMLGVLFFKLVLSCWVFPIRALRKLRKNGFAGPSPSFPMGNLDEMKRLKVESACKTKATAITHDIHSAALPHFARWQQQYGKVFVYWLGTEPFLYVADPEFLSVISKGVLGKSWGKPDVFKKDREPMFGTGLVMVEGDDWTRHRHIITPAFSPLNLKAMTSMMVESATSMMDRWAVQISSGNPEFDMESEIIATAGEIIAKTSFGVTGEKGRRVLKNLRAMQCTLFMSNRFVGVPLSNVLGFKQTLKAKTLGREIDGLLLSIINERRSGLVQRGENDVVNHRDLLGLLLKADEEKGGRKLTAKELVDECKTFFFAGHETTALALTWTLMLLAIHPEWQEKLREEIRQVVGDSEIDYNKLGGLKKMSWVMNEVLRLYSPAPNAQRQARRDIEVGDGIIVPTGTNIWIDLVAMHRDPELWGDDVFEFKPERFAEDLHGGCKHKMGFLPFGFGGRMCIGRNLTAMEYKVVLTLVLSRFELSVSPRYCHAPTYMLSLRPGYGLPLFARPL